MLITLARPAVQGTCTHHFSTPNSSSLDTFVSSKRLQSLNDVNSLEALARSVKANQAKAQLPADLAVVVSTELGDAGLVNIKDERVRQLYGFFVGGLEIPSFDPLQTLGNGWELQENSHPSDQGALTFSRYGDNVIQHLSFDKTQGDTVLHTIYSESFIATRHYTITQGKDGKLSVNDETAH